MFKAVLDPRLMRSSSHNPFVAYEIVQVMLEQTDV